jgi:iron complex transport system ATP-binding protein
MAQAGVAELADRSFTTLSGGEQQRVHFARVLAQLLTSAADPPQRPRLLLLDEPTASLDPAYQHKLLRATRQLAAQNVVVVVVLHDLNLAARFADRFMLLDQGRSVAQGAAAEVLTEQYLSQVYELPCRVVPHRRPSVIAPSVGNQHMSACHFNPDYLVEL